MKPSVIPPHVAGSRPKYLHLENSAFSLVPGQLSALPGVGMKSGLAGFLGEGEGQRSPESPQSHQVEELFKELCLSLLASSLPPRARHPPLLSPLRSFLGPSPHQPRVPAPPPPRGVPRAVGSPRPRPGSLGRSELRGARAGERL